LDLNASVFGTIVVIYVYMMRIAAELANIPNSHIVSICSEYLNAGIAAPRNRASGGLVTGLGDDPIP